MVTFLRHGVEKFSDINPLRARLILSCLVFTILILSGPVYSQNQESRAGAEKDLTGGKENEEQRVSIDFNDVDISVFIKFISELTGRNFIVDPRVKGKITVVSPSGISVKEAYRVFESVLEVHGYATVEAGKVTKIIPAPYARTMSIETKLKREADSAGDKVVTQVLHLRYAHPEEIKQIFAPLVSKSAVIMSYAPTNMLIVTDVYSNIKRLMNILDAIDVKGTGREIKAVPVEHANAEELVKIIDSLFKTRQNTQRGQNQGIVAVADSRTNTLVIQAGEQEVERVQRLVEVLDKEMPKGSEKIHVYYLENANAEELVSVLEAIPSEKSDEQGQKKAPIVSEDVEIAADKSTNSLILRAEKEDYEVLKSVIRKLDIPKPMVYIECLIMEVSKDKSFRLGAEWIAGGEASYEGREGAYGGGFSGGTMGGDRGYNYALPEFSGSSSALLPPGFSLGILGENIEIGNISFPTIRALIQAYKKDKEVHILSTPQLLTLDNETAKIRVGKNIPYLTRAASGDTEYSNYEYKDVGILLEITPQINEDRKLRLDILQEVTKLETTTDQFQPTTLKRVIQTTVEVNDKNTVVIGGLIDESLSSTQYRVPCLGAIPGLGWLFKSMANADQQTNLFVFITPRVMADPAEAQKFYQEKKKDIKPVPGESIKLYPDPERKTDSAK